MAKLIAVVGETGSGKSSSIQHLDPKTTYIVNVAGKELPFRGSGKIYNRENKNYKEVSTALEVLELIQTLSEKVKNVKDVIIEDGNYLMGFNLVNKATEIGYTKFSVMAKDMLSLIQGVKTLRDDLNIYYFSHQEEMEDSGEIVNYKMKTAGKLIDNQIKLEGLFTVVIYAITETKGDRVEYYFITNRYKKYPAKSPQDMFKELKMPNNLKTIGDTVREYYS